VSHWGGRAGALHLIGPGFLVTMRGHVAHTLSLIGRTWLDLFG
jgi:hypothetical protein